MKPSALILMALLPFAACNRSVPAPKDTGGPAGAPQAAGQPASIKGTVLERLEAPPYTYLRLKTAQGEIWAAVPTTDAKVGSEVTFLKSMEQANWDSPKLKRTFERLALGTLAGGDAPATAGAPGGAPPPHPEVATKTAGVEVGKIAKFEGPDGRTVAEIHAQGKALAGRTVAVRGRVMKVSMGITVAGIPGSNWVHLQDGSGASVQGTHDLTVTTDDAVAPGDLVVAKGKLVADPKIGGGYERALILQGAKVTK